MHSAIHHDNLFWRIVYFCRALLAFPYALLKDLSEERYGSVSKKDALFCAGVTLLAIAGQLFLTLWLSTIVLPPVLGLLIYLFGLLKGNLLFLLLFSFFCYLGAAFLCGTQKITELYSKYWGL